MLSNYSYGVHRLMSILSPDIHSTLKAVTFLRCGGYPARPSLRRSWEATQGSVDLFNCGALSAKWIGGPPSAKSQRNHETTHRTAYLFCMSPTRSYAWLHCVLRTNDEVLRTLSPPSTRVDPREMERWDRRFPIRRYRVK